MLVRAPALLCRTVAGASSARVRDSESGPNTNAPTDSATTAREDADLDAPKRIDDVPAAAEHRAARAAPTRSTSGVGRQATSAGSLSSQASIRLCPAAGTASAAPALDDVVVEVAGAGQPDAAVQDFEAPAAAAERHDGAAAEGLQTVPGRDQTAPDILRMHHGSP